MRTMWLALPLLLACDPARVEYAIAVTNEYPGTRIGIFAEGSETPLAITTKAKDTLQVQVAFKEHLNARFVDVRNARPLGGLIGASEDERRSGAKQGRPVPLTLRVSRALSDSRDVANVEVVMAGPTDEAVIIDGVPVDTKAAPAGTRLVVPATPGATIPVKVGTSPPVSIDLGYAQRGDVGPAGFVYIDPTASACVQTRAIVYGAAHLVGKGDTTTRRPPAKVHPFGRAQAPSIIFGEPEPSSVSGSVLASRLVFEACSAAAKR